MKKLFIVLCLFLFACGESQPAAEPNQVASGESQVNSEPAPVQQEKKAPVEETTSLFDLANALTNGLPVKCVSTKEGMTATLYFKGKNVRMDTSPVDAHGIYTQEWMYSWSGNVGSKMKMADLVKLGGQAPQTKSHDELVSEAQNPDMACESVSISDDMFVPPSDVNFQDLGALLSEVGMAIPQQPQ